MKHCPLHHVTYVPTKFEVAVPWVCLQFVSVVFAGHTHLLLLLRPMVKEMHYQANTLFDLDPIVKKSCQVLSTSCDRCTSSLILLHSTVRQKMHLHENTLFDRDLRVKVKRNVAQLPLHHVTYKPTYFEVTTSKGLGGDPFKRKFNI